MQWIGLTGSIGTGKSTVAAILQNLGLPVVSADILARRVVEVGSEGLKQVGRHFGSDILKPDGSLDRARLGARVFQNESARRELENILHPLIREATDREKSRLASEGHPRAVYDVPLLFEKKMESLFDLIVVVSCDEKTQLERIMNRDGLPREEALKRIQSQFPIAEKIARADYTIENQSTKEALEKKVKALVQSWK